MLPITSFFAGIFTIYYVRLAFAVIRLRKNNKVSLGAGGVNELETAVRVHGNFAEYVPLGLIMMGLLESHSLHPVVVAVIGALLALGRIFHAQGLKQADFKKRVRGMVLTFGSLMSLALINILYALRTWLG